jgi:hypothetical protein
MYIEFILLIAAAKFNLIPVTRRGWKKKQNVSPIYGIEEFSLKKNSPSTRVKKS